MIERIVLLQMNEGFESKESLREVAEDIPTYAAHPDHRAYVDHYLRPKLESIVAFNFEV